MSKSSSTASAQSLTLYNRYFEYERIVSEISVTDEGIFQKGQVPDNYGGAQLDLQCVHAVYLINSQSELVLMEFNVDPPMDKDRKKGGPVVRDGIQIRARTGNSTVPLVQTTISNTTLDDSRRALGEAAKSQFKIDLASQPDQQLS